MHPGQSFFWKRHPFLRALLPFAGGIVLQYYLSPGSLLSLCLLGSSGLLLWISSLTGIYQRWRLQYLQGLLGLLILLALGMQCTRHRDIRHHPRWFARSDTISPLLWVRLEETPQKRTRHYRARARVLKYLSGQSWESVKGQLLLYFPIDSGQPPPAIGTHLLLKARVVPILHSGNPGGFDFRRYCLFRGITHQSFPKKEDYRILAGYRAPRLPQWLEAQRERIIDWLRYTIPGQKESGLAEALLLGYRQDLDPELIRVYSNTGAVHVIAISGMHLGLIYLMLGALLKPLQGKPKGRVIRALLLIAGLWLFSLLAGASPSVLRAAVMFTCLVLGETLQRAGSVYNTLAFSAFVLLLINPFWLWDAGFQLSYAAVISILLFQRPLYQLIYIKNKGADAAWKLSTVTLAAQVFTAAISLYHFHQFPVYFWLSNLVAVPLSSIVLIGEILLCGLFFWPAAAQLPGQLLSFLIQVMNGFVEKVEGLPFSVWEGLQVDAAQTALLLGLPAGIAWCLLQNRRQGLSFSAGCLLALLTLRAFDFQQRHAQHRLVVYQVPRQTAIDLFRGRTLYAWTDSALQVNAGSRRFFLEPARILYRAGRRYEQRLPEKGWWLLEAGTKKIWLARSAPATDSLPPAPADLLLLSGKKAPGPKRLPAPFYRQVIADAAVPSRIIAYWQQYCDSLEIPFHAVHRDGAFVMPLH